MFSYLIQSFFYYLCWWNIFKFTKFHGITVDITVSKVILKLFLLSIDNALLFMYTKKNQTDTILLFTICMLFKIIIYLHLNSNGSIALLWLIIDHKSEVCIFGMPFRKSKENASKQQLALFYTIHIRIFKVYTKLKAKMLYIAAHQTWWLH